MANLFSVEYVLIQIFDYPLSLIEVSGTVFYILSVLFISQKNILTWPTGILSGVLYLLIFYQIQLYADAFLQIYFISISFIAWKNWKQEEMNFNTIHVSFSGSRTILFWAFLSLFSSLGFYCFLKDIHIYFPVIFPKEASYPLADSFTTIMSIIGMYLMSKKKTESWMYWAIVDAISTYLYWMKNVKLLSIEFCVFFFFAIYGFRKWILFEKKPISE